MDPSDTMDLLTSRLHRITLDKYHAMIDAGVFGSDDRCELIHGVLVARAPQSGPHAWAIQRLTGLLVRGAGEAFDVRVQLPLTLGGDSEAEPDFSVVPHGGYAEGHPDTAHLVIEVSHSSLRFDRKVKAPLYARAAIAEYWIVDVNGRCVEVYRDPDSKRGHYRSVKTYEANDELSPLALPGPKFVLREILV